MFELALAPPATKARYLAVALQRSALGRVRAAGGPGSGWTAENGHVPGSQGGIGLAEGYRLEPEASKGDGDQRFNFVGPKGENAGHFRLMDRRGGGVNVVSVDIKTGHRGQGLARQALKELAKKFGVVHSDPTGNTTADAHKMWKAAGGTPLREADGERRWRLFGVDVSKRESKSRTLGGPGSGWTAENGHVPGSQGGNEQTLYHGTSSKEKLQSILKDGITLSHAGEANPDFIPQQKRLFHKIRQFLQNS